MTESEIRTALTQNLADAGCDQTDIDTFLHFYDCKEEEQQIKLLERQRKKLLHRVHAEEKKISCLDYLLYQIQKKKVKARGR